VVLVNFARSRRTPGQSPGLLAGLLDGSSVSPVDVPLPVNVIRMAVLVAVVVTVPLFTPHFATSGLGIAVAVTLGLSAASWLVWQFAGARPRLWLVMLIVMGASGGALAGLSSLSTAVSVGFVVAVSAGARLPGEASLAITAETIAAFIISGIVSGAPPQAIAGWSAGYVGFWAFGLTRHAFLLRAEEAEDALAQARRAHAAETQAAALAERARIAREIHDVLAHSLAAVSVNLQAAEGLLEGLPGQGPEITQVVECVQRAGALTREGMAETRRAILALRGDADGEAGYARPGEPAGAQGERLTGRLRALADEHGAAGDAPVEFTVTGTPRPLGADAALTAFRTAQESLTNARKHAPGQPVRLDVSYAPDALTLTVRNPLPAAGADSPLAQAGAGYGLTGLRERAALARGTLAAGPEDGQWRVCLRLPG
jgi:signal transduction histidine kinase